MTRPRFSWSAAGTSLASSAAVAFVLSAGACSIDDTSRKPYGQTILEAARPGEDFESFLERAARESEIFRRQFLDTEARRVISAVRRFQTGAAPHLEGRPGIAAFQLSDRGMLDQLAGAQKLSGAEVFGAFSGRWYGLWTDFEVDHHWGEVVQFDVPRQVEIPGSARPVWVLSYQYAWVGDGYGLNLVVSGAPPSTPGGGEYILGYVVHVEDGDLARERSRRPHVGIFTGAGQLVWITAREVFLEASYTTPSGSAAYSITGFRYEVTSGEVRYGECFQALYTREPEDRPPFFSFALGRESTVDS